MLMVLHTFRQRIKLNLIYQQRQIWKQTSSCSFIYFRHFTLPPFGSQIVLTIKSNILIKPGTYLSVYCQFHGAFLPTDWRHSPPTDIGQMSCSPCASACPGSSSWGNRYAGRPRCADHRVRSRIWSGSSCAWARIECVVIHEIHSVSLTYCFITLMVSSERDSKLNMPVRNSM